MDVEQDFIRLCDNNKIDNMKQLKLDNPEMNVVQAFRSACTFGHFAIVRWLVTYNIDLKDLEIGFSLACAFGHLEIVKWLKKTYPGINITFDDDKPIKMAYKNNHINVINWLIFIHPHVSAEHILSFKNAFDKGNDEALSWIKSYFIEN